MIIVSFGNGLGNQMFQYTFYLSLKKAYAHSKQKILADVGNVFPTQHDSYQLNDVFGIEVEQAALEDIIKYSAVYPHTAPFSKVLRPLCRIKKKLLGAKKSYIYLGDQSVYHDIYYKLNENENYYVHGAWCNTRYLTGCEEEIRQAFVFQINLNQKEKELREQMRTSESVSIHLRRGDYVGSDFYILAESYYRRAVEEIKKRVADPVFFVFSDDIECAQKMFSSICKVIFVSDKTRPPYHDMYLMSQCRHNVIANSTFSFWGAYLNANTEKVVVCPDVWMTRMITPLYCDGWVMIENSAEKK